MITTMNMITQSGPKCDVDAVKLNESLKGLPAAVYFDLYRDISRTIMETLRGE